MFLREEGAPFLSHIVEGALTTAILNGKNAYFFKTEYGAMVGDLLMSIIQTCHGSGNDPFHYLTVLQDHAKENQGTLGSMVTLELQRSSISTYQCCLTDNPSDKPDIPDTALLPQSPF